MASAVPVCPPGHKIHPPPSTFPEIAATSTQPPELRPHILPFGTTGSGTSPRTTSPPQSSSSARRKSLLDRDIISNKLAVKTVVQKLELESEENYKQEEIKKKETEKKMSKKTMMKKKEDILDLSVKTVTAYLQGLGPEDLSLI